MDQTGWDDRYRERPLLWSAEANRFVVEELSGLPVGAALDVACGEGRNAVWLAKQGWLVTAVDFSAVALERAAAMADQHDVAVTWVCADIMSWDPGRRFDLVVVSYLHLTPDAMRPLMARITSWVAPGGRLFMVGHDRSTMGINGPTDPSLLWDIDSITALVGPLEVERARVAYRGLETGEEAADTVLIARRI